MVPPWSLTDFLLPTPAKGRRKSPISMGKAASTRSILRKVYKPSLQNNNKK